MFLPGRYILRSFGDVILLVPIEAGLNEFSTVFVELVEVGGLCVILSQVGDIVFLHYR